MDTALFADKKTLQINSAALTDRGRRRNLNEDAVFQRTIQIGAGQNAGLYLVCDGLGGHQAGEVASRLAVETVTAELAELLFSPGTSSNSNDPSPNLPAWRQHIETAILTAHAKIQEYARNHSRQVVSLGTTITLALLYGDVVQIANVGDGRAYAWRAGEAIRLTEDHSIVAELVRLGQIEESEIAHHPWRNVLSQALGIETPIEIDLVQWKLQPGDKLLLCSDGLWQAFADTAELASWLSLPDEPAELCRRLVQAANQRDGSDNISAVIVSVEEAPIWQNRGGETKLAAPVREMALTDY
jgi:protein phosphatase